MMMMMMMMMMTTMMIIRTFNIHSVSLASILFDVSMVSGPIMDVAANLKFVLLPIYKRAPLVRPISTADTPVRCG
jgi:hypothetical protein